MALKPTIYKAKIALSDLNNEHYAQCNVTLAQHPSETLERMVVRLIAYCLHHYEDQDDLLHFTKGLSSVDEPDLWLKTFDQQCQLWIDVGEPAFERIKKASRLAKKVWIYSFNSKSGVWWQQQQSEFADLPVSVGQFNWQEIQQLAVVMSRTVDWSITISGDSLYVASDVQQIEVNWQRLQ
jgi:uncharacterized protein YaeQ